LEKNLPQDSFVTDDTITYKKTVPENACPYAQLNSIGGMTYKSNNLIPFPYVNNSATTNGVTFTVLPDGGIKLNGTATGYAAMSLNTISDKEMPSGKVTFSVTGTSSNALLSINIYDENNEGIGSAVEVSSSTTIDMADYPGARKMLFSIKRKSNAVVKGVIYPMVNIGETALPYQPGFKGLRHSAVTELKSCGINKLGGEALSDAIYSTVDGSTKYEGGKRISLPC
jgi:hypothetical protein